MHKKTPSHLTTNMITANYRAHEISNFAYLLYGGATAIRARVAHLPLTEHGVLMVKVVMKSAVIISIQHI